ncbi:hypothetical protein [Nocardioides panaciterrulae]|uniref:Uncharacterized protein n=1 Tax=Nocardioides panaciterrulae TaxID=661492 RepID=A0A7Y9E2I8_9ACTN|nr:hypothetical protein [Nocardioides panaciterrulae]NYD40023.1 hypothetical protein [Nocardioides panaciterrulae]
MKVYVSELPSGNPPALLRGRFSAEHGTFALLIGAAEKVRGKRTRKTVSIPFFHCLGKNLGTVGSYTGQTSEFRSQIQHWFTAYDARHLTVFNGDVLFPATMQAVFEYAATVPEVTFVCEPGGYERTRAAVLAAGVTPEQLAWDDLLDRLPPVPDSEPLPEPAYGMEHLPTVDFLLFRHHARTLNEPQRFTAIDANYRAAYAAATTVEPNLDSIVAMLAEVTRTATDTAPIMVALRATQVALLTRGWLLNAHQDKAIGTLCSVRSPNPTDAHWRALHGYVRTPRVAGVALYLLDIAPDVINAVTIAEVERFLHDGHVRGRPLPDLARPLLKAHLAFRRGENARDGDPYLNQKGPRRHLEDLIDARRHLGIPIDARFLRGGSLTHTQRPIWRFGLELRDLT